VATLGPVGGACLALTFTQIDTDVVGISALSGLCLIATAVSALVYLLCSLESLEHSALIDTEVRTNG
jgi:hypothetical protein